MTRSSQPVRVLLSGSLTSSDLRHVRPAGGLELLRHPAMGRRIDPEAFAADARSADLVLFRLTGQDPAAWMEWAQAQPALRRLFAERPCPIVLWSQDSHRLGQREELVQRHFDRYYLAHRAELGRFGDVEARWLPVGYSAGSIENLRSLRAASWPLHGDLSFAYEPATGSQRNRIVLDVARRVWRRGLHFPLGRHYGERRGFGGEGNMKWALLTAPLALNISHSGDLNLRCFEALALDRVLLSSEQHEMEELGLPLEHTRSFRRDLSDFDEALDAALAVDPATVRSGEAILAGHTRLHRYLEIINRELGCELSVELPAEPPAPLPGQIDLSSPMEQQRAVELFDLEKLEAFARGELQPGR